MAATITYTVDTALKKGQTITLTIPDPAPLADGSLPQVDGVAIVLQLAATDTATYIASSPDNWLIDARIEQRPACAVEAFDLATYAHVRADDPVFKQGAPDTTPDPEQHPYLDAAHPLFTSPVSSTLKWAIWPDGSRETVATRLQHEYLAHGAKHAALTAQGTPEAAHEARQYERLGSVTLQEMTDDERREWLARGIHDARLHDERDFEDGDYAYVVTLDGAPAGLRLPVAVAVNGVLAATPWVGTDSPARGHGRLIS